MKVNYYSWAKHVFQCTYLQACEKIYRYKPGITFYYCDLFSGDGICKCKLPTGEIETWDGSARSALHYCNNMGKNFGGVIFNDLKSADKLSENIQDLIKYPNKVHLFNERADDVIDKILDIVPKNSQSFFFLDPNRHKDLSWKTIEKIGNHATIGNYKEKQFTRRPEIMINLMTMGMQRNYMRKSNQSSITKALGTDKWIEEVKISKENGEPIHLAFERVFYKQLKDLYHDPLTKNQPAPYSFEVRGIKNQVVYYMFFISSHPLANQIFRKLLPYMEKYKRDRMAEYVVWKARASGIKPLKDFF